MRCGRLIISVFFFSLFFFEGMAVFNLPPKIKEAEAAISDPPVATGVNPGWSNNRQRVVFHNGYHFFLLYTDTDGSIYYKYSTDNGTWFGPSTLVSDQHASALVFDIHLVNYDKFDLAYINTSGEPTVVTCDINGSTITPGTGFAITGDAYAYDNIAVTRSGGKNRIYVFTNFCAVIRLWSANQTGDVDNVISWTQDIIDLDVGDQCLPNIAMVPYQYSDKVLIVYTKSEGGPSKDGVYSRVIKAGEGEGSPVQIDDFNNLPDISSPVSISDTDFRIIVRQPGASALEEWTFNGSTWTQVDVNIDPGNRTVLSNPSLFYDRMSGDMHVFSVLDNTTHVERHYKPYGGSWQATGNADAGLGLYSYPITQMYDTWSGGPRELVWAYRASSTGFDLMVGNLGLGPGISSSDDQVFQVGQTPPPPISPITITEASSPSITALNDIRIKIADGVDMVWDTSIMSASASGTAVDNGRVSASPSVTYEGSGKVLVIPVGPTDFAAGETLTITGLQFTSFNSVNAAKPGLQVFLDGPADTVVDAWDDKTIAIGGAVTLADHNAGQVTDKFAGQTESETTTEYFQFQLDNDGERASTTLTVDLSSISGIFTGDVTNVELWADMDVNGVPPGNGAVDPATAWSSYATTESEIYALTFDSTNNVIYAGAPNGIIFRCETSTGCDEFTDWTISYDTTESQIRSLFFDSERNVIYAGSNGTGYIYRCDTSTGCDEAADWTTACDPNGSTYYSFALDQTNNVIYAVGSGSSDNIIRCDTASGCDEDTDWSRAYGSGLTFYSVTFDSTNKVVYAGNVSGYIYRCDTTSNTCINGDGWTNYDTGESAVESLIFDSVNNILYAGTGNAGVIYRCDTTINGSCDDFSDWTTSYDTPDFYIWSFTFDSNNVLYAGTGSGDNIYSCDTSTGCDEAGDWTSSYAAGGDVRALTFDSASNVIYGGDGLGDILRKFEGDYKVFDGVPTIAGASGTIAFNPATILPAGTMDYLLRATISNIADGDRIAFGLDTSGVVETGEVSGQSLTVSGSTTSVTHWRLSPFGFRKSITIDRTKIPGTCGTTLPDFPMLFSVMTDGDLKTTGNDGDVASYDAPSNDPRDIIFRALDDDTCGGPGTAPCTLDHEIEKYVDTSGELVAWVRVPSVNTNAASSDTVIYIYYGNSTVTSSTQNANAVWDSNYVGVWHLHDDLVDSSSDNDGTDSGGSTNGTGQMADGQTFDGNDDYIYTANSFNDPQEFTISAWFKTSSASGKKIVGFEDAQTGTGSVNWDRHIYVGTDGKVYFGAYDGDPVDVAVSTNTHNDDAWHYVVGVRDDTTNNLNLYVDGNLDGSTPNNFAEACTGYWRIGSYKTEAWTNGVDGYFPGTIDEVRVSNIARNICWIGAEYSNQKWPNKTAFPTNGFITLGVEEPSPATAVSLVSFTAKGKSSSVLVEWETAQEINNMGFQLYRATSPWGPFSRLTDRLVPGLTFSVMGKTYTYEDTAVTPGELYYYKLEDIDVYGKHTFHGPICVDWDGDGLPDDWEIAHGLNPGFDEADLDWDGDGLSNLEEYLRGTDPFNSDTDGDGILDGEDKERDTDSQGGVRTLSPGIYILAADETGTTLELRTDSFDFNIVQAEGQEFERLRITEYIHGFTHQVGEPELPVKGILLDIPEGNSATLTVLQTEDELHTGYRVYPVPENAVYDEAQLSHVGEVFVIDEAAYSQDTFYPEVVARLGEMYVFRGQQKQQLLFHPLTFNPANGEIRHHRRIRVRVDYVVGESAKAAGPKPAVWAPPTGDEPSVDLSAIVKMAMAYGAPSVMVNSLSPVISPMGMLARALWLPPAEDGSSAAKPVYKILLSEEGIYRLTKSWLEASSVDVTGIDLSQVRLYNLGQEIALSVYDQNGDNHLDTTDYIEFYGRPVAAQYEKYAKHNVYWLTTSGGTGSPKRMAQIDGAPGTASVPDNHTSMVHHEKDERYWLKAPGEDSLDRWFFSSFVVGDGIEGGGNPVDFTLTLPDVAGQASLKISMCGVYDTDHQVDVSVNGTPVGTYTWSGIAFYELTIDPVVLFAGDNTVTLQCKSGTDSIAVDWFEVDYPRSFTASNDMLKFFHLSGYRYQISGFTGSELLAFDITSPGDVGRVVDFQTTGTDPYTLDMEPQTGGGERTYLVLSSDTVKTPMEISEDAPSTLFDPANGADYILITHRDLGWDVQGDLYPWLSDLTALRQAQGLRVKVVDVADIFDELSYGIVTPEAIRDFLTYAYENWSQPAPQYVLLVGSGNWDYKDNYGELYGQSWSSVNYLPTYLIFTEYMGETATDEWFVKVSGDDAIADLYIGRLPAKSANEAALMVGKIIAYESAANTKSWEKNILLVSDNQVEDFEVVFGNIFEDMNEDAAALIPTGLNAPFKGYLDDYLAARDLTSEIKEKLNEGAIIINYSGHGSTQIWADEKIFQNGDVADLTNSEMLPFFVSMSCLTGYFAYPEAWNFPSLADALLQAEDKGAVAALMPTGMTTTQGQQILNKALFDAIFTEDIRALGRAVSAAKQTLLANGANFEEVSDTFLLFGDPAMKLKIPLPRRPSALTALGQTSGIALSWQEATDCNGYPVSGYNLYRSTTPGGPYTKVNTSLITGTGYEDIFSFSSAAASAVTSVASGNTYYYVVTSVDSEGDESVYSEEAGATQSSGTQNAHSSGGGGGGGCFISSAAGL